MARLHDASEQRPGAVAVAAVQATREAANDTVVPSPEGGRSEAPAVNVPQYAVLSMSRLRPSMVPWAVSRLVRGPSALAGTPGLRFARVLGSGHDAGFGLRPGLDCQGVYATFDALSAAQDFADRSRSLEAYRSREVEGFRAVLRVLSSRGSWAGQGLQVDPAATLRPGRPVAVLTRASIRPSKALRFWALSPDTEEELAAAPGCRVAVGLGEAPVLRQATFSLWDSVSTMEAFAHHGAHQRALRQSWMEKHFSEWMFVRFAVESLTGRWAGHELNLPADAARLHRANRAPLDREAAREALARSSMHEASGD